MTLEPLLAALASMGITATVKADHERYAEAGQYWTVVFSGPGVREGLLRGEARDLSKLLTRLMRRLDEEGVHVVGWEGLLDQHSGDPS
jgi:hypothetical protein